MTTDFRIPKKSPTSKYQYYYQSQHQSQSQNQINLPQPNNSQQSYQNYNAQHHTTQYHRKNDSTVDYKYICIKKDYFDVNMIHLNYTNLKKCNYIEIIYKSPSIFLEGVFMKTPQISSNAISVIHKDRESNNITIKISLNNKEHSAFIQILRSIDEYISSYINRISMEIETELNSNVTNHTELRSLLMFRYDQIVKYRNGGDNIEMHLKSYLDKSMITDLEDKTKGQSQSQCQSQCQNQKYIFTFNISNIYFGSSNLIPLIKCNRCEIV